MSRRDIIMDQQGAAAIEFAITAPAFFIVLFGIILAGLLLWTQFSLQHGVEMAARCATVNTNLCGNAGAIQNYAAQHAFGLDPPPSIVTVATQACGNQVTATYTFQFLTTYFGLSSLTLNAQSCFPK